MRSAIICHAAEDAALVGTVCAFLEANCPLNISLDEGLVRPGFDLIDAAELGLSADLVFIALSPASVPAVWKRERWEPVFRSQLGLLGTPVVFLLLRECRFPELFRRGNFFDLSRDPVAGQRDVKRWLFALYAPAQNTVDLPPASPMPARNSEELRRTIADRPGIASGLDAGSQEQNRNALRDWCANCRCLFIFDHLREQSREVVRFEGKASVIFSHSEMPGLRPLDEIVSLFSTWPRNPGACLRALGDAQGWLTSAPASGVPMQLGNAMAALLRNFDRLAEAHEILALMANAARSKGDLLAAHRLVWEQSAIQEQWGEAVSLHDPIPLPEPAQLALEF